MTTTAFKPAYTDSGLSPFPMYQIDSGTITGQDTFRDMRILLQKIFQKEPLDILETSLEIAISSPTTKLLEVLNNPELINPGNLVLLKLLTLGFRGPPQKPLVFTLSYRWDVFYNVSISDSVFLKPTDIRVKNSVLAAVVLDKLMVAFDDKISFFNNIVLKIRENLSLWKDTRVKVILTDLVFDYLPSKINELIQEYRQILFGFTPDNFVTQINLLADFLEKVRSYDNQFFTMQAVNEIMQDAKDYHFLNYDIVEKKYSLNCVNQLLPKQINLKTDRDHAFDVFYYFMVGFYLTQGMCSLIQKSSLQLQDYSFRKLLTELQTTNNKKHRAFFKNVLKNLESLCNTQIVSADVINITCEARMNQSKVIMNEIAVLYKMLYTWKVPALVVKIEEVPVDAIELTLLLQKLKILYLTAHVPNYKPEIEYQKMRIVLKWVQRQIERKLVNVAFNTVSKIASNYFGF